MTIYECIGEYLEALHLPRLQEMYQRVYCQPPYYAVYSGKGDNRKHLFYDSEFLLPHLGEAVPIKLDYFNQKMKLHFGADGKDYLHNVCIEGERTKRILYTYYWFRIMYQEILPPIFGDKRYLYYRDDWEAHFQDRMDLISRPPELLPP